MLMNIMADENTPVKQVTRHGVTTLAQDPSNYYPGKILNPQPVYSTPTKTNTGGTATAPSTPIYDPAPSSGGGGGGESSGGGGGFDWGAYLAELMAERQRRADEAYERNMQRIASAYNSAASNLKSNYDSTESRLNASRDQSLSDVNSDAEKSLQQAYLNNMLTKKNLNQRLSAMGYNGGATESTMAKMENNYGNSRTSIGDTLNNNVNKLNMSYGDNLANALQSYNSALADLDLQRMQLEMQAEQQRQAAMESIYSSFTGLMGGSDSSYLSALQDAVKNMGSYSYDPSAATNYFVPGQAQQAASATQGANYAKYLAQAQLDRSNGVAANEIKNTLFNAVRNGEIDINSLYDILRQLGSAA